MVNPCKFNPPSHLSKIPFLPTWSSSLNGKKAILKKNLAFQLWEKFGGQWAYLKKNPLKPNISKKENCKSFFM